MQMSMNEKKLFLFTSQLRTVACKKKNMMKYGSLYSLHPYIYIYIFLQDKTFKQERKYDSSTVILNNITGYVRARSSS